MALLRRLYGGLKLRINASKSAVARFWDRKFLGFSFWVDTKRRVQLRVANKALHEMKRRVRLLTRRQGGRSLDHVIERLRLYLVGWRAYFRLAETPKIFRRLDEWIRHRLRAIQLKQWKRGRTYRELLSRGLSPAASAQVAANTRRWWKNSAMALQIVLPNRWFAERGLPSLGA